MIRSSDNPFPQPIGEGRVLSPAPATLPTVERWIPIPAHPGYVRSATTGAVRCEPVFPEPRRAGGAAGLE